METIEHSEYVTIGELVRLTGVRYSTLKFYTEEGMLPFEQAEENLTRRYRRVESIDRITYIRQLRDGKMTIPEIKKLLEQDGEIEENCQDKLTKTYEIQCPGAESSRQYPGIDISGKAGLIQDISVYRDGDHLPRDKFPAVLQSSFCCCL